MDHWDRSYKRNKDWISAAHDSLSRCLNLAIWMIGPNHDGIMTCDTEFY